jgi:acetyl-CoA C-acetyltransferase
MALEVVTSLLDQTGLAFHRDDGLGMAISVSDDVFDARTISDNAMTDVLGGHMGCEEKVAQEGAQAVYYGAAAVQSGHVDALIIVGHCKESQGQSRNMVTHLAFDPFYTRPVGLDFCSAAALQAQAYQAKTGLSDDELADIVVQARLKAALNPQIVGLPQVTREEVLASPLLADPIRELHAWPVSDGAVGLVLASEEVARRVTDNPVWVTGVGNNMGRFFLGDRDLASTDTLTSAAQRAYQRAGVDQVAEAFDVVELSDQYAYQQPLWLEGLGFCASGQGPQWLQQKERTKPAINPSGGMLAGNPMILGGLVRVAECALQLRGQAGKRQVQGARRALAHGVMGPAGQFHSVVVMERD